MKRKIKQLLYFAVGGVGLMLLTALPHTGLMAQKAEQPLNPALQGLAKAGSTARWIEFMDGTTINPTTLFKEYKAGFELTADDDMRIARTEGDEIGFHHYRYQQYYKDLKVVFGEFIVHQNKDNFLTVANGRLIKSLKLDKSASQTESNALNAALHFMNAKKYLWQNEAMQQALRSQEKNPTATYYPKGELVYAPGNYNSTFLAQDYKLAWSFKVYTDDKDVPAKNIFVDALTGKVLFSYDISMSCSGGSGGTAFNGTKSFSTELTGGSYRSHNDCQATDLIVYNCNGGGAANNFYTDADNAWTLTSQESAAQAQYGIDRTHNYYLVEHSRTSWDGPTGTADMIAYNNAFAGSNNACWGCTGNSTIFYAGNTSASTDDWNTDDIMGHEFTHGVTQASAGLVYNKESGALNESFSDIFGEMVESWSEGNCDYLVGADRGAIRSFITPNTYGDPDTYLGTNWVNTVGCTPGSGNDNCGVHTNSGVQNHWFYLLSEGGSGTNDNGDAYNVTGITRFKARDIAYRSLEMYLISSSDYIDARKGSLRAAFDLYGGCSTEIIAVGDAWHAVGVESLSPAYLINVCGVVASGDIKQAISVLTGANGCANSIATGASITYYLARDRVTLYTGFIAPAGSRFRAYLEPCSSTRYRGNGTQNNDIEGDGGITMSDPEKGIKNSFASAQKTTPATSVNERSGISMSPNPFVSSFELSINSKQEVKAQVSIYNSLGIKVKGLEKVNLNKGSNNITVDGSSFARGVYMVEITMGDVKTVRKIVKM